MWSPASAMLRIASVSADWPDGDQQRADAALQGGDAVLDDRLGRVHDPGVDVAELLQREQLAAVLGGVEGVRRRLVDRQRPGAWWWGPGSGRRGSGGSRRTMRSLMRHSWDVGGRPGRGRSGDGDGTGGRCGGRVVG